MYFFLVERRIGKPQRNEIVNRINIWAGGNGDRRWMGGVEERWFFVNVDGHQMAMTLEVEPREFEELGRRINRVDMRKHTHQPLHLLRNRGVDDRAKALKYRWVKAERLAEKQP